MRASFRFVPLLLAVAVGCGSMGSEGGDPSAYPDGRRPPSYPSADGGVAATDASFGAPMDESEGDDYEALPVAPFVRTAHDPFSTFGADVDTASYDIFVRDATDGFLPQPESVRLEEYVNSFAYDYDFPADTPEPFAIHLDAAAHPYAENLALLRVGIQAEPPPEFQKRPTTITFLMDTSGSMQSADKLPLAQRVMRASLDALDPTDEVAIVSYAGDVAVRLAPTPVSNRAAIEAAIAGLTAGGGTAGASGIHLAYDQAQAAFKVGGFNHVVLCTDGDFNIGISDTDALVALIEEKRETGVTLTALGFGRGNLNDAMMERVSNAGNGFYSVITSEAHADRYARENLLQGVHLVAKDVKIQLELNPEHVVAYRLLGYENRAIADDDFRVDTVDAGEVGADHRVTALYELVLTGSDVPTPEGAPEVVDGEPVDGAREIGATELVRVKVRWKHVDATSTDPAYETMRAIAPEDVGTEGDEDFAFAAALAMMAQQLRGSPFAVPEAMDAVGAVFAAQAGRDDRRAELAALFSAVMGE
ncbi:MAG: von Willebrand factor type A domain-containing protein [Sandaracinus sp.]|nr:von Willebrand factor type A domain-containing protein [Sandaracinus sp.]